MQEEKALQTAVTSSLVGRFKSLPKSSPERGQYIKDSVNIIPNGIEIKLGAQTPHRRHGEFDGRANSACTPRAHPPREVKVILFRCLFRHNFPIHSTFHGVVNWSLLKQSSPVISTSSSTVSRRGRSGLDQLQNSSNGDCYPQQNHRPQSFKAHGRRKRRFDPRW